MKFLIAKLFGRKKQRKTVFKAAPVELSGEVHDLREIYDRMNALYFEGALDLPIQWFGNKQTSVRTRITLGSYNHQTQQIKIHRILDQAHIPKYFIDSIVYHEMLHHVLPPIRRRRGRRHIHHTAFVARERQFQQHALAQEFSKSFKKSLFQINA